jgi:hypothetical protein
VIASASAAFFSDPVRKPGYATSYPKLVFPASAAAKGPFKMVLEARR